MVEEPRDIRDRGYLAINLLLGGIAVAVGLFDMFILHTFTAASMFDAFLGISMITIGILFIAPYMAPRALGLPGPGTRMVRRPYLPYPAPIPEGYGEEAPERRPFEEDVALPRRTPRSTSGLGRGRGTGAAARSGSKPTGAPPLPAWRTSTTAETEAVLTELETLGVPPGPAASYGAEAAPSPLAPIPEMPVRAEHPPPAEYLEEDAPELSPELEPQLRAALAELEGVATGAAVGSLPLQLVNGKPPAATLAEMEDALRAPPPLMAAPPISPSGIEAAGPSDPTEDAMSQGLHAMAVEIDHIAAPTLDPSTPGAEVPMASSAPQELPVVSAARVGGEAPGLAPELAAEVPPSLASDSLEAQPSEPSTEAVTSDEARAPAETAPSPQGSTEDGQVPAGAQPSVGGPAEDHELPAGLDRLPTVEQALGTPEARLDEMAKTLDGMLTTIRPPVSDGSPSRHPLADPRTPEPVASGQVNEGYAEEDEPEPGMEELERQLAAMRSVLALEPPAGNPAIAATPPKPRTANTGIPQVPKVPPASPGTPEQTTEDDLQQILDQARSALTLTEGRHEGVRKRTQEHGR